MLSRREGVIPLSHSHTTYLVPGDIPAFLGDSIDGVGVMVDEREDADLLERLDVEVLARRIVAGGRVLVGLVVVVCAHAASVFVGRGFRSSRATAERKRPRSAGKEAPPLLLVSSR